MLEFEEWLTKNYGFTTNDGIWKRSKITMKVLLKDSYKMYQDDYVAENKTRIAADKSGSSAAEKLATLYPSMTNKEEKL